MEFTIHFTLGGVLIFLGLLAMPVLCMVFKDCESGGWGPPLPILTLFFTLVTWAILIITYVIFH